jgi:hypothetical protein
MAACERMKVRSAQADSPDGHESFTLDGGGLRHVPSRKNSRSSQNYLLHVASDWINLYCMPQYGIVILDWSRIIG